MKGLPELLDLLKSKGVASFSGALEGKPVSVAFAADVRPMLPLPSQLGESPSEICACGHEVVGDHNHEGCLHGCGPDACDPPMKKPRRRSAK